MLIALHSVTLITLATVRGRFYFMDESTEEQRG